MRQPKILLETARLFLRELCPEDAPLLFELDCDPAVMRFISKGIPTPRERFEQEYLPRMMAYQGQLPPRGFWAAHLRDGGEFIGWFHLRPDKITPEEMELGYRLKQSVWGGGLATEGSRALVEKAFREWSYGRISARTLAVNLASRRVMEKSGLTFECEFFYGVDVFPDWTLAERRAVKYSLTCKEFLL